MDIVHPKVERYLRTLIPPRDRVMAAMETRAGRERVPIVGRNGAHPSPWLPSRRLRARSPGLRPHSHSRRRAETRQVTW
jgi:hypothetical protein